MIRLAYFPLEPYQERYTELLTDWTLNRFREHGFDVTPFRGRSLASGIRTGVVLDAHGRSHWSLTQLADFVAALSEGARYDAVYFDDMFTPGYEALPYIFDQQHQWPVIVARNHAQSMDIDDFTFPMLRWMRHYELMLDNSINAFVCASMIHKETMLTAGFRPHVHVLGLPFDLEAVRNLHDLPIKPLSERPVRVIYSSRFDREKQPHFFMDIVERMRGQYGEQVEFVICSGASELRSNDPHALERAARLERQGLLRIMVNATKADYYRVLAASRVQINTARQDWVSYTAIEASAFGTPTLAPCFRSFPEALHSRPELLYVPWSLDDACAKLCLLLFNVTLAEEDVGVLAAYHDRTLDRIANLIKQLCRQRKGGPC